MNSLEYLLRLDKIFDNKSWKIKENYKNVFNSLCDLAQFLIENKDEYNLFFELINEFSWISLNDYYSFYRELLIKVIENLNPRIFNIYAFPIIKYRHQNVTKSGNFAIYLIKGILESIPEAKKLRFEDINNFEDLQQKRFTNSDLVILIDDFIGSGETFNECINKIEEINKHLKEKIIILTLAINKDSLENIRKNYKIFYKLKILKGITDYNYSQSEIENKKNIMRNIEKKLINGSQFSLGHKESENLITLLRTPDNTFPIFWQKYKKRINIQPPFPRDEK